MPHNIDLAIRRAMHLTSPESAGSFISPDRLAADRKLLTALLAELPSVQARIESALRRVGHEEMRTAAQSRSPRLPRINPRD